MFLLKTLSPWLLLVFLGLQVSLSSGARTKTNRPAVNGTGKFSNKDGMKCTWGARYVSDTVRLSVKCEDPEARVTGGVTDLQCEYNAKPLSCPGYLSNNKGFWKQVARGIKKLQGNLCRNDRTLLRISMCKRAPRDTHFKLDTNSSVEFAQSGVLETTQQQTSPPPPPPRSSASTDKAPTGTPTACTKRANHRKTAEENCSGSWASLCNFFLSMLQSDNC